MPNPKVSHAIKDVVIVVVGVLAVWMGLRVAFATDNPFYVVSSGSMEPVLNIYDVLIVKDGSTFEKIKRGDIIVFNRPEVHDRVIVHRVVDIRESSERVLTTKGDANPASIPGTDYPITKDDYIGEVVYVIPKIGYVTRLINPPINYIIIAIILAILFFNRASSKKSRSGTPPTSDESPSSPGPV
jgi:signal peptidase